MKTYNSTKGESLFKRQSRYILTYTLKGGKKPHNTTLKSSKPIKSMEEAETLADKHLSQYGELVTSRKVSLQKESGYILKYEDVDGRSKEKRLYDENDTSVFNRKVAQQLADDFLNEIRKIKDVKTQDELLFKHAQHQKIIISTQVKLDFVWDTFMKSQRRNELTQKTLNGHQGNWKRFNAFLKEHHPNISNVFEITSDLLDHYFSELWATGMAGRNTMRIIKRCISF